MDLAGLAVDLPRPRDRELEGVLRGTIALLLWLGGLHKQLPCPRQRESQTRVFTGPSRPPSSSGSANRVVDVPFLLCLGVLHKHLPCPRQRKSRTRVFTVTPGPLPSLVSAICRYLTDLQIAAEQTIPPPQACPATLNSYQELSLAGCRFASITDF